MYQGVKRHGFIQPHILAEQDVVITTYDVLRTELNYVDIPHSNSKDGRRFRNQKRYMAIPSPLVAVEWWRVCLDEAQMVECTTAKVYLSCSFLISETAQSENGFIWKGKDVHFYKKLYLFRQQRWLCVSHLLIVGVSVEHLCREVWKVSRINISFKKCLEVCVYIHIEKQLWYFFKFPE